jgi:hypothetical protein
MVPAAALALILVLGSRTVAVAPGQAAALAADATLQIAGDIPKPLAITPAELKTMPRTAVTVSEEAKEVHYEGVLVGELLKRAGAPLGRELSGKALTTYVQGAAAPGAALSGVARAGLRSDCVPHRPD